MSSFTIDFKIYIFDVLKNDITLDTRFRIKNISLDTFLFGVNQVQICNSEDGYKSHKVKSINESLPGLKI